MIENPPTLEHDELLALPISQVIDGWTINNGKDLYLWIKREDANVVQTVVIPRKSPWQKQNG